MAYPLQTNLLCPYLTPTLAIILTYTGDAKTVDEGTVLLIFYSIGLSSALFLVGMAVARILFYIEWVRNHKVVFEIIFARLLPHHGYSWPIPT